MRFKSNDPYLELLCAALRCAARLAPHSYQVSRPSRTGGLGDTARGQPAARGVALARWASCLAGLAKDTSTRPSTLCSVPSVARSALPKDT